MPWNGVNDLWEARPPASGVEKIRTLICLDLAQINLIGLTFTLGGDSPLKAAGYPISKRAPTIILHLICIKIDQTPSSKTSFFPHRRNAGNGIRPSSIFHHPSWQFNREMQAENGLLR